MSATETKKQIGIRTDVAGLARGAMNEAAVANSQTPVGSNSFKDKAKPAYVGASGKALPARRNG